jgi:hypothetical protein
VDKALWSTTSACASVPGSSRVRPLTPNLPPYVPIVGTPCLKSAGIDQIKSIPQTIRASRVFGRARLLRGAEQAQQFHVSVGDSDRTPAAGIHLLSSSDPSSESTAHWLGLVPRSRC